MIIANSRNVFLLLAATGLASPALAEGTMDLAPTKEIAVALSDQELADKRGGFMGLAFSVNFLATIDSVTGNVSGTGSSSTSTTGVTSSNPPINYNLQGNNVQLSTFVGNLGNLNGVFAINTINGFGNVVNSNLTINVALVTLNSGGAIPGLNSLFGH